MSALRVLRHAAVSVVPTALHPSLDYPRSPAHRHLHSFPTRRSSDLRAEGASADRRARAGQLPRDRRAVEPAGVRRGVLVRSEEHTSELQSQSNLVCRLLLEKKKPTAIHRSAPAVVHVRVQEHRRQRESSCRHSACFATLQYPSCPLLSIRLLITPAPPPTDIYTLSLHDALPI